MNRNSLLTGYLLLLLAALSPSPAPGEDAKLIRVVVWDEQQPAQKQAYSDLRSVQAFPHLAGFDDSQAATKSAATLQPIAPLAKLLSTRPESAQAAMKYSLRSLMIVVTVGTPPMAGPWLINRNFRTPQGEAPWDGALSLIHGTGQTIKPDASENELPERIPLKAAA